MSNWFYAVTEQIFVSMDVVNALPDESVGSNEEAHLLESNMHTQQCGGRRQTFSMKKFILLWLGIGHFYCELNVGTYWKMHTPLEGMTGRF